jgi:hypothetical protein
MQDYKCLEFICVLMIVETNMCYWLWYIREQGCFLMACRELFLFS